MTEFRCKTCRFYDAIPNRTSGLCRVNAPKVVLGLEYGYWPITQETDWCGDGMFTVIADSEEDNDSAGAMQ